MKLSFSPVKTITRFKSNENKPENSNEIKKLLKDNLPENDVLELTQGNGKKVILIYSGRGKQRSAVDLMKELQDFVDKAGKELETLSKNNLDIEIPIIKKD